ncbi:MAG: DUF2254 domain-containing protein [Propionicimonas sp.]
MNRLGLARLQLWWERAFWVIPVLGVAFGIWLNGVVTSLDDWIDSLAGVTQADVSTTSALSLLGAIGGGMVTFTGFVFSFVVLLLQFGSSQYSPRTVSHFLRARSTQVILAVFLATVTFSFLSLLDVGSSGREQFVPMLTILVAVGLLLLSLAAFIALLHSVGGRMRVDAVLSAVGRQARRYLQQRGTRLAGMAAEGAGAAGVDAVAPLVVRSSRAGQVIAVDLRVLRSLARRRRLRIAMRVQVGDAVSEGSALMRVWAADGKSAPVKVSGRFAGTVVVDQERSLRHDAFYSLRLLVDVAIRALSPAVNDPTTAVRSLDEIEGVLRVAAHQQLGDQRIAAGAGEVIVRIPSWSDVVLLGLLEIMTFGIGQPQVTRRLMVLLDDLMADVPQDRRDELATLRASLIRRLEASTADPEAVRIALRGDRQGLGGTLLEATVEPAEEAEPAQALSAPEDADLGSV